jgi:hypothetical protein
MGAGLHDEPASPGPSWEQEVIRRLGLLLAVAPAILGQWGLLPT